MKYSRIVKAIIDQPWAIIPTKLEAMVEVINIHIEGREIPAIEAKAAETVRTGSISVIPVQGIISQRMNMMSDFSGGTSTEMLERQIKDAAGDDSVTAIVMDVDSPGGSVYGVQEVADTIFQAREKKPIVAVANSLAASAAYWIGTAASELVVTPGGEVGSVGVVAMHVDQSEFNAKMGIAPSFISAGKFKTEGHPHAPLDEEARDFIQSRVDDYYDAFVNAVARQRDVSAKDVRTGFGEGRVVGAKAALKLGMADRIGTLNETLARLGGGGPRTRARSRASARRRLDLADLA